jgi:hypothetical protein
MEPLIQALIEPIIESLVEPIVPIKEPIIEPVFYGVPLRVGSKVHIHNIIFFVT